METIGWVTTSLVALALICWFLNYCRDLVRAWAVTRYVKVKAATEELIKQRRINEAWWFSQDKATMQLLLDLANGRSVNEARRDWLMRRETKEKVVLDNGKGD